MSHAIAIVTANSNSGSGCLRDLINKYHTKVPIRAAFRTQDKAQPYIDEFGRHPTFQPHIGIDAAKIETLKPLFTGAHSAVIVTPLDYASGWSNDADLTLNMISTAVECGVRYIVYVGSWTVEIADKYKGISSRFVPSEDRLRQLSRDSAPVMWTSLRSGYFCQNVLHTIQSQLKDGNTVIRTPKMVVPAVDPEDMGRVAAAIMAKAYESADPEAELKKHDQQYYDISGPKLQSMEEMVAEYAEFKTLPLTHQTVPVAALKDKMPPPLFELVQHLEEQQEKAVPISDITRRLTGHQVSWKEWLATHA